MSAGLTRMQFRALEFIDLYVRENGISPSFDEIAEHLGLSSRSQVHRLVTKLEERGKIRRRPNSARSIEITGNDAEFHLRRILCAIQCSGFIRFDDRIVREACRAMRVTEFA